MPTIGGKSKDENEQRDMKSIEKDYPQGMGNTGASTAESWTGAEEKVYPGSTSAKSSLRSVAGKAGNTAEELWDETKGEFTAKLGDVAQRGREVKDELMDRAKNFASDISNRASDTADAVTTKVKENPLQSMLIGFGIGCIVGVFASRIVRR